MLSCPSQLRMKRKKRKKRKNRKNRNWHDGANWNLSHIQMMDMQEQVSIGAVKLLCNIRISKGRVHSVSCRAVCIFLANAGAFLYNI